MVIYGLKLLLHGLNLKCDGILGFFNKYSRAVSGIPCPLPAAYFLVCHLKTAYHFSFYGKITLSLKHNNITSR
jgi:hypothetical protein